MRILLTALVISVLALAGCGGADRMEIRRLDRVARQAAEGMLSGDSLRAMEGGVWALMAVNGADSTVSATEFLAEYGGATFSTVFGPDVESRLHELGAQERELAEARRNLAGKLPELEFPAEIYGIITPYRQSVVRVDSVMLIGLNHYLGADYEGYESFGAERVQKTPERMAVEAVSAMVMGEYPFEADANGVSLLQMMLYDGAVTAAVKEALPEKKMYDLLGMDSGTIAQAEGEEREIWRALAEKGLLFSTDISVNSRLMMPAEHSDRIYPGCPGRAARYIGWRIVESYMKRNPEASLSYLLQPEFYNSPDALRLSAYNP